MTRGLGYGLLATCLLGLNIAAAGELEELRERAADLAAKARALNERGEKAEAAPIIRELQKVSARIQQLEHGENDQHTDLAAEANRLRDRAAQLKIRAAELIESGHKEDAHRLLQEAAELSEGAHHLDVRLKHERSAERKPSNPTVAREEERQRLHARLKDLHVAHRELWASDAPTEELVDIRHHIRRLEAHIAAKFGNGQPQSESSPEALKQAEKLVQRIEHLRAAAEHLQAADMPEMAHELRARSKEMEHKAHMLMEQAEQESASLPPAPQPAQEQNESVERALRQEIEALRKELEALRKQRQP